MEGGRIRDTGLSGKRVKPMTRGTKPDPGRPEAGEESVADGGASPHIIPEEAKLKNPGPGKLTAKEEEVDALADAVKGFEDELAKAEGVTISAQTMAALRSAQTSLSRLTSPTSEEDTIMTEVTKQELADTIAQSAVAAVKAAMDDAKKAKKAKKAERAEKVSNNKGDVTDGELQDAVHSTHEANDVAAAGGPVAGRYKNAKKGKKLEKQIAALAEAQKTTNELVTKMATAPRRGGPILDGIARGAYPANEGRQSEVATKSEDESKIETMEKQLHEELAQKGPEAANRASATSWQLTRAKLRQGHLSGEI